MEETVSDNIEGTIKAYQETIDDFEIELRNTGLFAWKTRKYLDNEIAYYEDLISNLRNQQK